MDVHTIIGCAAIAGALILILALVLWSRRTIHRIAERGYASARQLTKELDGGR